MLSRRDLVGGCIPSAGKCPHRTHQRRRQQSTRKRRNNNFVLPSSHHPSTSSIIVHASVLFFAYIFSTSNKKYASLYSNQKSFSFVVHAFSTPKPILSRSSSSSSSSTGDAAVGYLRINHALQVASIDPPTTATTNDDTTVITPTRQELEKMTVKQLKTYIQETGIEIPKGQSSTLKLKKNIVDFIWNYQLDNNDGDNNDDDVGLSIIDDIGFSSENDVNGDEDNDESVEPAESVAKATSPARNGRASKKPFGTGMPPLPTAASTNNGDDNEDDSPYILTPKDRIVLDVLNQYPPLHESIITACANADLMEEGNLPIEGITTSNIEQCDLTALNYVIPTDIGEADIRHTYHPMMANVSQSDMDVVFIGTASCTPGVTRGVSCTALRLNWRSNRLHDQDGKKSKQQQQSVGQKKKAGTYIEERGPTGGTWLFDCGESTQLSVQKTASVKPGKISKIFITHCHGDHSFGLPGLLCLMGTDRDRDAPPIEIYGPEGLRMWLRVAVRYSVSRVVPSYRVHELMDVPMAPEWEEGHRRNGRFYFQLKRDQAMRDNGENNKSSSRRRWGMQGLAGEDPVSWISRAPMINLEPSRDFGEIEGGRDIYPQYDHPQSTDGAPIWIVEEEDDVTVTAAPMSHGVPCVGYVVREHDRPGRLKPEAVLPVIERNSEGLKEAGIRNPMKVMAMVKNLPEGGQYEFPDGTILRQEDVVEPMRQGRKVVICGDTADCRALEGLAQDADLLVHEATNTFLPGVDKDGNMRLVTRDAKIHGHSTPIMAGDFAKRINAKKLVLNHFSARYKGDQSIESMTIMTRMERQAMKSSGLSDDSVAAAWDFMVLPIARND